MSLYNGPPRGGTRGGKDQFSWESVKADKDREFYLGHSVKATTGRWQKGKDVFWYTREKQDGGAAAQAELFAVKQREEELMAEALGIKPKTVRVPKQPSLDQKDMAQLMQKDEEEEEGEGNREAERIKGLGYSVNAVRGAGDAEHELMPGTVPAGGAGPGGPSGALPPPPALSTEEAKRMRKAQKKAGKEARRAEKKEKRKAKKALKRAKKDAKRAKLEQDRSPAVEQPGASTSGSERSDSSDSEAGGAAEEPDLKGKADGDRVVPIGNEERGRGKRQRHDTPSPDRLAVRHERGGRDERRERPSGRERDRSRERRRSRSPANRRR